MGAQFRSHFVFPILAGTILPNNSLMWLYNEHHHGKGPMDSVGGTVKKVLNPFESERSIFFLI